MPATFCFAMLFGWLIIRSTFHFATAALKSEPSWKFALTWMRAPAASMGGWLLEGNNNFTRNRHLSPCEQLGLAEYLLRAKKSFSQNRILGRHDVPHEHNDG